MITIESPLETLYGDSLNLVCRTVALPTEYASHVQIEWWGPNRAALDERNGVTVGVQQSDGSTLSRSLQFAFLTSTMDGVYTCHFNIEHMNETYTETKTYTLEVSGIANETLCCECVCLCHTGRIAITGNDVPLVAGMARTIRCNWNSGGRIDRLSWFLEGLYTIPLSSSENTASVDLYLDATSTGLNDTNFVCRATSLEGDAYQEMTTVIIKGIHIQVVYRKTNDLVISYPLCFQI